MEAPAPHHTEDSEMTIKQTNRTGKPGAVQLGTLKVGDKFSHDTNEAMVASATHTVKSLMPERNSVQVCCFGDGRVTRVFPSDWYVFKR